MSIIKQVKQRLLHYSWELAYGEYDESLLGTGTLLSNYHVIKNPYKNKWFADPFIYKDTRESIELFVEEFDYMVGRGRIGHLIISKKTQKIEKLSIILEKETHLSFPAIYRIGDAVYVHPENSASGKSFMYRYNEELDKLIEPIEVLAEPVTDAVIEQKMGKFMMYATKLPNPNGKELFIYQSDTFWGPYVYKEKMLFDKAYARLAGAMFKTSKGEIFRPSQDCEGGDYGKAVLIMIDGEVRVFLTPPAKKYAGLHTFNCLGGLYVVDLKIYDFPLLYRIKTYLKG